METTAALPFLPIFVSPAAETAAMATYQVVLERWPVPFAELDIPTSFGRSHVIASGPQGAPAVLLLHALFASAAAWFPTAGALSQTYRVYAVDMLGEPNKSRPTRPIRNMDDHFCWFRELLDGLGVTRAHLVGNSVGGFYSLAAALEMPERVEKVVLIAPAATFHQIFPFYWHFMVPKVLLMSFPKSTWLRKWLLDSIEWMRNGAPLDSTWADLFYHYLLNGTGARMIFPRVFKPEELRRLRTPTLLLIGDKEVIYQPQKAISIARRYLTNLSTAIIPNANHMAAISQPEIVNQYVLDFLA
jgi:pimeloyl-ACP methyl ester carboxylesterase